MAKRTCIPSAVQFIPEDTQSAGSRICIEFIEELQSLGISPIPNSLELLLSCASAEFKAAFLRNLEIFLTEAVQNIDIQACYQRGKVAHQKAHQAHITSISSY